MLLLSGVDGKRRVYLARVFPLTVGYTKKMNTVAEPMLDTSLRPIIMQGSTLRSRPWRTHAWPGSTFTAGE